MSNGYIGTAPLGRASESSFTKQLSEASDTINVPGGYAAGGIEVRVNGLFIPDKEYTAADGINVVFPTVLPVGTTVTITAIASFSVPNLSAANNSVIEILSSNLFLKEDNSKPLFSKTSNTTLSTNQRFICSVGGKAVSIPSGSVVTMAAMTAGKDYAIYLEPSGVLKVVVDPYSAPSAPTVTGAIKVGGFHYGLVAPGTTPASGGFNNVTGVTGSGGSMLWTQADVDKIAGINAFSIWDKGFRCAGEQRGMAYDPYKKMWAAIYFCGTNHHLNGISTYITDVASGTVLPTIPVAYGGNGSAKYTRLSVYEAFEIASAFGLRLPTYEEFSGFAFGVTEGQSLGGAASTIPATIRQPGYTSRIGLEQATGHQYTLGGSFSSVGGTTTNTSPGRGSFYGTTGLSLLGGARDGGVDSGSRAIRSSLPLWTSGFNIGLRAVGDHFGNGNML